MGGGGDSTRKSAFDWEFGSEHVQNFRVGYILKGGIDAVEVFEYGCGGNLVVCCYH